MAFQIPAKIYLQIQDIDTDEPIQSLDGCTWCADRIMKTDVLYVLPNEMQAENARLRDALENILRISRHGDVNIQPILAPIIEQAINALK